MAVDNYARILAASASEGGITPQQLNAKADKVIGATNGDLASLDTNGNLTDSGKKASDFVETEVGKGLSTNDYTNIAKSKVDKVIFNWQPENDTFYLANFTVADWDRLADLRNKIRDGYVVFVPWRQSAFQGAPQQVRVFYYQESYRIWYSHMFWINPDDGVYYHVMHNSNTDPGTTTITTSADPHDIGDDYITWQRVYGDQAPSNYNVTIDELAKSIYHPYVFSYNNSSVSEFLKLKSELEQNRVDRQSIFMTINLGNNVYETHPVILDYVEYKDQGQYSYVYRVSSITLSCKVIIGSQVTKYTIAFTASGSSGTIAYSTETTDFATKVANPTNGNFAGLDANGNLTDSGKSPSDITSISNRVTTVESDITSTSNRVTTIESEIPAQASSSNQLADKNFVNSSIGTNTAYYISNNGQPFNSLAELQAYAGTVTNNDYAFVTGTDESGNTYFDRYKASVIGSTVTWAKEYRLNNSSFTAAQWAAISSGITAALTVKITTNESAINGILNGTSIDSFGDVETALATKQNTAQTLTLTLAVADWVNNTQTVSATGVTTTNIVIVDADNPDVQCTAQGSGTLTFTATTTPTTAVNVKVVIL